MGGKNMRWQRGRSRCSRSGLYSVLLVGLCLEGWGAAAFSKPPPAFAPSCVPSLSRASCLPGPRWMPLSKSSVLQLTMQRGGAYQRAPRGKTGYGPELSTDFVRRERSRGPIPGDRRRGKIAGKWPASKDHGFAVKNGQLPKDLHIVNDVDVLIDILEAVAGVTPVPPSFPAPQSRDPPSPPTRAPQDFVGLEESLVVEDETAAASEVRDPVAADISPAAPGAEDREELRAAREEELSGFKVADLKALCKENGLKVGGKKAELVDRILEFEDERHATEATSSAANDDVQSEDDLTDIEQQPAAVSELDGFAAFDDDPTEELSRSLADDLSRDEYGLSSLESEDSDFRLSSSMYDDPLDLFRDFGPIKYLSTRGNAKARWRGRFGEAVREGIPVDGGLLVPHRFPDLREFLPEWKGLSLNEIGARVSSMLLIREVQHGFLPDLYSDVYGTFADPANPTPLTPISSSASTPSSVQLLELFHGPTRSADDLVMEPLGRIIGHQMSRRKGRFSAVVPWRPEGGGGVASVAALRGAPHSECFVLCSLDLPDSRALDDVLQLAQAPTPADAAAAPTVHPVFMPLDSAGVAQVGVEVSREMRLRRQYGVTLFDSRNVAHVMLSLSHVIWAVLEAQAAPDSQVVVAVDQGDGTQATAALYARLMGLPIKKVVVAAAEEASADGAAAELSGMERVAFELAGRDPGMLVEAEEDWQAILKDRNGGSGLEYVQLTEEMEEAARDKFGASDVAPSTLRALAALEGSEVDETDSVVVLATEGGQDVAPTSNDVQDTEEGGAVRARRRVLVGSPQSVGDFIAVTLPPELELYGQQVVAAMHHLKRLSPSARDKQQRRKCEDLMDALMRNLMAQVRELSVKDTCLALKVVSDEVRKTEAGAREAGKKAEREVEEGVEVQLLLRLRERLEQHLDSGSERLSSHLLGLALNALSKAGKEGPELVAPVLDPAQALLLERHPDSIDTVALVHIAAAFSTAAGTPVDEADAAEEDAAGVDLFQVPGEDEWRRYGKYGRLALRLAGRLHLMDPSEFQPNAFPPLALLLARSGLVREDPGLRLYLENAILGIPPPELAAYPLVFCEISEAYLAAGLAGEALCVRLAAAVPFFKPQYLTPPILCRVLDILTKLHNSIPPPPPHPFLGEITSGHPWLGESSQAIARLSTNLPPSKWTAPTLSRFLHRLDQAGYAPPEPPFLAYTAVALKFLAAPPPPPSTFDPISLAGLVRYYGKERMLEGEVLAALEEGLVRIAAREGEGSCSEWRTVMVGAARGDVREGALFEEPARQIESLLEGGEQISIGDAVAVLETLSSSSASYSDGLIERLFSVILAEDPTELPPQLLCLLCKAASLQPPDRPRLAELLGHVQRALEASDSQRFNPSHLAAIAASVERMREAWAEHSGLDPDAILPALSAQTVARASSLYTRHTARVILQTFMLAGHDADPAVTHLERIAKGRPTLKSP